MGGKLLTIWSFCGTVSAPPYPSCSVPNRSSRDSVDHEELLRWLLDNGGDPNLRAERQRSGSCCRLFTPLTRAAHSMDTRGLEILLSYGAELDPMALHEAIECRSDRKIAHMEVLYHRGVDINYWTRRWGTPLDHAVHRRSKGNVQFLLERGADATIRNVLDKTPAEMARDKGLLELVELLENAGIESP